MYMGPPDSCSRFCKSATSTPPPLVAAVRLRCWCCCCWCAGAIGLLPGELSERLSGISFSVSGSTLVMRRIPIRWLTGFVCESCAVWCDATGFWCRFSMDLDLRCGSGERFIDSADTDGVDLPLFPGKRKKSRSRFISKFNITTREPGKGAFLWWWGSFYCYRIDRLLIAIHFLTHYATTKRT